MVTGVKLTPLSKKTAMITVSTSIGITKSRISRLECEIDYPLMELFYNVTVANFVGQGNEAFTKAKLQSVAASLGERSLDIMPLIVSFFECASDSRTADVIVKGHSRLLSCTELGSTGVEIIELLRNREAVASLMDTDSENRLSLKIGSENEYRCLRRAAVIKANYYVGEEALGTIGVIGQTKTDYSRVIPLVKYISEITGSILTGMAEA